MGAWSSVLVALLLFFAAGWLIDSHLRTWSKVQKNQGQLEPNELDYRRRQFRRRMQTSAMLGMIGIAILVGQLISLLPIPRLLVVLFWGGVMLMAIWLGMLAIADMVSTRFYFARLKQNYMAQEARLQAELRRLQRTRGNGQAAGGPDEDSGSAASGEPDAEQEESGEPQGD